jgi:hypothetical protein
MVKDNNVNITIEVCKDKNSGNLYIRAHFDTKAPNVFKDKDFYTWMPTIEEQSLLNDAFEFMPIDSSLSIKETPKLEIKEKIDEKPISQFSTEKEPNLDPKIEIEEKKEEPIELPKIEKQQESDLFEVTDENLEKDNIKIEEKPSKDNFETVPEKKEEEKEKEIPISSKIEEDDGIIVEADSDAIEAALEKHMNTKDETIVEADEKTIIDRVLKQKKKGKWRE